MPSRTPLYSRSRATRSAGAAADTERPNTDSGGTSSPPTATGPGSAQAAAPRKSSYARVAAPASAPAAGRTALPSPKRPSAVQSFAARHERRLWALALLALAAAWLWTVRANEPLRAPLTGEQITHLVRENLQQKPLPSQAAAAYAAIRGSVVRVVGLDAEDAQAGSDASKSDEDGEAMPRNVGTGVVIVDDGTILTNLHVVQGSRRLKVTFADGSESDAVVVGAQPENDLAVLRAKIVPDDLKAATMRSTGDLSPGDEVLAVGFPFGIGPSASQGVVSGLKREFRSPDGRQMITNLIQFDAAANPGNSGGPLVTMDGAVVGIVTAILNPSRQRVFIGIGFAVPIENAASAAGMHPF
jgi:S1-C subfamily serine protease